MRKINSTDRYQTEKAIIDALLKISEIIKKTTRMNRQSKRTSGGDGDQKQHRHSHRYNQTNDVPIPPSMRTLESNISGFNHRYTMHSSQRPTNCNRAPIILWNPRLHGKSYCYLCKKDELRYLEKRFDSFSKRRKIRIDHRNQNPAYKCHRYYASCSSESLLSDDHYGKRSSRRYQTKRKSSSSKKSRGVDCFCQTSYDHNYLYSTSNC
ncbi:hypothetical protein I4U23_001095 [Adineta vaga]|nr:hypothetical protein I4U23_001095 [Adineta vaga]